MDNGLIWWDSQTWFDVFSHKSDSTIINVCPFVCSFVCLSVLKQNFQTALSQSLHPSSFIIHHSSFTFFIHPSFISRLLSFSACFQWKGYKAWLSKLLWFLSLLEGNLPSSKDEKHSILLNQALDYRIHSLWEPIIHWTKLKYS